jgi:hypothetical protein
LTLYLPADQPVRVGFQYKGQNGAQVALDSILLETSLLAPSLSPIENADGDGSYLIDWTDVVSATGYLLEEDESPAFGSPTARYSGPNSEYTVSGQPPGTWYYRVKASDGQSDSRWSNTEMAGVKPNAPTLSSISNPSGGGSYLIDWTDVASATSYVLEEDDNSSFDSPTTRYSGAASEYSVSGQLPDTWYYRVKASAAAGDSPWSNTQSVRVSIRIYVPLIVRQAGAHQLFSK